MAHRFHRRETRAKRRCASLSCNDVIPSEHPLRSIQASAYEDLPRSVPVLTVERQILVPNIAESIRYVVQMIHSSCHEPAIQVVDLFPADHEPSIDPTAQSNPSRINNQTIYQPFSLTICIFRNWHAQGNQTMTRIWLNLPQFRSFFLKTEGTQCKLSSIGIRMARLPSSRHGSDSLEAPWLQHRRLQHRRLQRY